MIYLTRNVASVFACVLFHSANKKEIVYQSEEQPEKNFFIKKMTPSIFRAQNKIA